MKTSIVCLLVPAVVRNHLSSSSFRVFRIGGVLVFVKDQGLSRVFGFPSFGRFCVSSFDVFEFPFSKGDCIGFLSVNGVGAFCCVLGRFPSSLLCVRGVSPLLFVFSSFYTLTQKNIHSYITHVTQEIYTHLPIRYLPFCL